MGVQTGRRAARRPHRRERTRGSPPRTSQRRKPWTVGQKLTAWGLVVTLFVGLLPLGIHIIDYVAAQNRCSVEWTTETHRTSPKKSGEVIEVTETKTTSKAC